MAALASSLIRQKREVREPGGSRPVSAQRRVCPRGTKSLCQKQLLILLSKVRLCGGRPARLDRGPGEWLGRGVRDGGLSAREVEMRGSGEWSSTEGGKGVDHKVSASPCLSFPPLLPVTPSLLAFEGKGKA